MSSRHDTREDVAFPHVHIATDGPGERDVVLRVYCVPHVCVCVRVLCATRVCVCVCVCKRKREVESARGSDTKLAQLFQIKSTL